MPGFCNKLLAGFPHPQDGTALHKPAPNPSHSYLPLLCKLLSKTSCQIQPPNILPLVIQLSMINLFLLNPTNIPPWASSLIMTWSVLLSQTPLILIFQASISLSISCTFLVAIQSPRHVQLFAMPPHPQTAACQASLSITQLLELAQSHVHRVGDAIQSFHPLWSSLSAFNLSQHPSLFQWVIVCIHVHYSFQFVKLYSYYLSMECFCHSASSVQSLSHVQLFVTPWTAACQASLSITQLLELAQSHVHWVGDAIQPAHSLPSPSPPAFNLSQHQDLFQWVSSLNQVAKVLELQFHHQSFQWIFRTDFL